MKKKSVTKKSSVRDRFSFSPSPPSTEYPYRKFLNKMTPNDEVLQEWMLAHGLPGGHNRSIADNQYAILLHTHGVIPDELKIAKNPYYFKRGK